MKKQKLITVPKNWKKTYALIQEMRKNKDAPVDTVGCERLHTSSDPKEVRYQTLLSLMLSSQTKDQITAESVKKLTEICSGNITIPKILALKDEEISSCINKVSFYNRKVQYIKKTSLILSEKYENDIPKSLEELVSLPGVGPKMAYIALNVAWDMNVGIGVDVHVHRIANRLHWAKGKTPEDTRKDLEDWLPKEYWNEVNVLLVGFGQTICKAKKPSCSDCLLKDSCPSSQAKNKVKN